MWSIFEDVINILSLDECTQLHQSQCQCMYVWLSLCLSARIKTLTARLLSMSTFTVLDAVTSGVGRMKQSLRHFECLLYFDAHKYTHTEGERKSTVFVCFHCVHIHHNDNNCVDLDICALFVRTYKHYIDFTCACECLFLSAIERVSESLIACSVEERKKQQQK